MTDITAPVTILTTTISGDVSITPTVVTGSISTGIKSIYNVHTVTADYTITTADDTVLVNGSSNNVTISLVTAVGIAGRIYVIKCIDATFTVDIDPYGTEEIDGDASNFELMQDEILTIQSDGVGWQIL